MKPDGNRDAKGRFLRGNRGGPGRPATPEDVREFWRAHTIEAAETVVKVMREAPDLEDKLRAAVHVLDRSLGKPVAAIDVTARAEGLGQPGDPDAARRRLEGLIAAAEAERQSLPPVTPVEGSARDLESGAVEVRPPTESGAEDGTGRAPSGHSTDGTTP